VFPIGASHLIFSSGSFSIQLARGKDWEPNVEQRYVLDNQFETREKGTLFIERGRSAWVVVEVQPGIPS